MKVPSLILMLLLAHTGLWAESKKASVTDTLYERSGLYVMIRANSQALAHEFQRKSVENADIAMEDLLKLDTIDHMEATYLAFEKGMKEELAKLSDKDAKAVVAFFSQQPGMSRSLSSTAYLSKERSEEIFTGKLKHGSLDKERLALSKKVVDASNVIAGTVYGLNRQEYHLERVRQRMLSKGKVKLTDFDSFMSRFGGREKLHHYFTAQAVISVYDNPYINEETVDAMLDFYQTGAYKRFIAATNKGMERGYGYSDAVWMAAVDEVNQIKFK